MSPNFHPFVLPFTIGTLALFSILIMKYNRWISKFDRQQKKLIRRNLFTGKLVPAVWEMIREGLFHLKVSKHSRRLGYMHRSIALGWFLLISIGFIETVFHFKGQGHAPWIGVFFRFFVRDNQTLSAQIFAQVMDLLLLYILSGVAMAVFKSVFSKTVGMRKTTRLKLFDASLRYSLWSIFPFRLLSESATAALVDNGGFLTQGLGNVMGERFAGVMELPFWTMYSIALGLFLCLLPFSRYAHIFSELMLIYFRKLGLREREKPTGFTQFELSACSRCGICIDNCPFDSELDITDIQPVYLIRDMRNRMPHHNAIDNCLMCNRCESDCPVGIQIS
ncbi:MAG: 4Fe-4S dicluster domain-containing protein, partial [Bacteroidales bacterium]